MAKSGGRKIWMLLGAAAGGTAVLRWAAGRIRNCHYQLISDAGEELLSEPGASGDSWAQYPRPQMRRDSFISLNQGWELDGQNIRLPFPPQSVLSGYGGKVPNYMNYSRKFRFSREGKKGRILLHFGAVDQVAEVFLNGCCLGKHEGGYLPFSFDITEAVSEGSNELLVKVKDTLSVYYPYGKQRKKRGGMWYTPVSGIWQSVWMEWVPRQYIAGLQVETDMHKVRISVRTGPSEAENSSGGHGARGRETERDADGGHGREKREGIKVRIALHDGTEYTMEAAGREAEIDLAGILRPDGTRYQPILWNTEHPYLYRMTVSWGEDTVQSYFGLRTMEVKRIKGIPRVCLNGEPIFLQGVLDQGYFCDGIYLPARETEYEQDVLRMKELGMNLLRKHIKIEPEWFYYYCDVHGMLVMQDMVNSGAYSWIRDTALPTLGFCRKKDAGLWKGKKRRAFFVQHMEETIRHLRNHPCIIAYTIFNEGWGQFESDAVYRRAKALDGTRLYDATSGWFTRTESDFDSQHIYFQKLEVPETPDKPVLVSECGGYSLRVPGHFYAKYARYGYGACRDQTELAKRVRKLYEETILPEIPRGLCGCIYTQLCDVEDEVNGFYTYDRKVCKVERKMMQEIAERLSGALAQGGKVLSRSDFN